MIAFHGSPELSRELREKVKELGHGTIWNLDSVNIIYILNDNYLVRPLGGYERCNCDILTAEQFLEL